MLPIPAEFEGPSIEELILELGLQTDRLWLEKNTFNPAGASANKRNDEVRCPFIEIRTDKVFVYASLS